MRSRRFNTRLRSGRWCTTALRTPSASTSHIRLRIRYVILLRIILTILLLIMAMIREVRRLHIHLPHNLGLHSLRQRKGPSLHNSLPNILHSLLRNLPSRVRIQLFRCLLQGPLRIRS